ncbi:conserved hypothetical protein [Echinococcus multilocularis]|uniref:Uncharacterized protein n=1 Tax=Echinococcus multilocularis TaxID=6211 RepID=A0A068YNI3_ECHMU|nr:conserved hypothetical protein [Echinococcus multilocularis]
MVVGGVINTGEISGGLDLQADIGGDLGFGSRGVLGGLINTGFIGGGVNVRSSVEKGGGTGGGRNSTGGTDAFVKYHQVRPAQVDLLF